MYHVILDLDANQVRHVKRLAIDRNSTAKDLLTGIVARYLNANPVDQASSREEQNQETRATRATRATRTQK